MKNNEIQRFLHILKRHIKGGGLWDTSVLIAYYMLLSLAPLLIAVGNSLPFFNINPVFVIDYINVIVPEVVQPILRPIVSGLLTTSSGSLLSLSLVGLIWSASKGVGYIQKGMNKAYLLENTGSYVSKKLVSLLTILLALALMMVLVLAFGFGEMVLDFLAPYVPWAGRIGGVITDLKWPVTLLGLFCLLALVYRVTPDIKIRLRHVLPGTAFATAGLLLLMQGFGGYIRFVVRRFSGYETLGTFFVLMFWLNFSALIVLLGAVINASISEYRFGPEVQLTSRMDGFLEKKIAALRVRISKKK